MAAGAVQVAGWDVNGLLGHHSFQPVHWGGVSRLVPILLYMMACSVSCCHSSSTRLSSRRPTQADQDRLKDSLSAQILGAVPATGSGRPNPGSGRRRHRMAVWE